MEAVKSLTLSRKFSGILILISAVYSIYLLFPSVVCNIKSAVFAFTVGALGSYPMISGMWKDVEENWEGDIGGTGKGYKDFFTGELSGELRDRFVRNHWSSVKWIVPYAFTVYLYLSFSMLHFFGGEEFLTLFAGSVFMVGIESLKVQSRLSED